MLSVRPTAMNAEPSQRQLMTKTPGRALSRNENAHRGPATVQGKGKNVLLQTPFNANRKQQLNDKEGTVAQQVLPPLRPLIDQTPFINRTAAPLQFQTPYGPSFNTPDSVLRPSSLRRHIRTPRTSGVKAFQTPENQGNPWDCDVSIEPPSPAVQPTLAPVDDLDEIEYAPPNTLDLAYFPPFDFDLPNYSEVGSKLRVLSQCPVFDDIPPPDPEFDSKDDLGMMPWEGMIQLPELESNDPFVLARKALQQEKKASAPPRAPIPRIGSSTAKPGLRAQSALSTTKRAGLPSTGRVVSSRSTAVGGVVRPAARPASAFGGGVSTKVQPRAPIRPASVSSRMTRVGVTRPAQRKEVGDELKLRLEPDVVGQDDFMFSV